MFLEKYVNAFYLDIIMNNYDEDYIMGLDENNFAEIYELFAEYEFYFIDDIILKYLEIFELDLDYVNEKIIDLKEELGNNFVSIIGNNMNYLEEILS